MSIVIITGSTGLVGSESVEFFCKKGFDVIGIDNNLRSLFFGKDGSTNWIKKKLQKKYKRFKNFNIDIRNLNGLKKIFKKYGKNTKDDDIYFMVEFLLWGLEAHKKLNKYRSVDGFEFKDSLGSYIKNL